MLLFYNGSDWKHRISQFFNFFGWLLYVGEIRRIQPSDWETARTKFLNPESSPKRPACSQNLSRAKPGEKGRKRKNGEMIKKKEVESVKKIKEITQLRHSYRLNCGQVQAINLTKLWKIKWNEEEEDRVPPEIFVTYGSSAPNITSSPTHPLSKLTDGSESQ